MGKSLKPKQRGTNPVSFETGTVSFLNKIPASLVVLLVETIILLLHEEDNIYEFETHKKISLPYI